MTVHPIPLGDDGQVDRIAWLTLRQELQQQGHFSASSAGVLWDCHPFQTLGDVATQHIAPAPIDDRPNEAMQRGHFLEPALLRWFEDRIGALVISPPVMYAENGVLATLDGEIVGSTETVECKTTSNYVNDVEPYWRAQVVAQCLAKPNTRRVHVVVLDASLRFQVFEVEPTTRELDDMAQRVKRFLAFVALQVIPGWVDLSETNVKTLWPAPEPAKAVEADEAIAEVATEWAMARMERLALEKREKAMRDRLADFIRDAELLTIDNNPVVSYRANGKGRTLAPCGEFR